MRKLKLEELGRMGIEDFKLKEKFPIVLILDNIRSALNVGSAFRTVDALGIEKIILCGITAKPPHREINKTAIGATSSVDWVHVETISSSLIQLKEAGYQLAALEQTTNSVLLQDLDLTSTPKLALILGNEVNGVSDEALEFVNMAIEIPQFGTKHSFNVTVSAGIALWEILRKMGKI